MKTIFLKIVVISIAGILFASCARTTKELNRNLLPIVFADLGPNDYNIVKGLTAEVNLTGKIANKAKVYNVKKSDKKYELNSYVYSKLFEFEHNLQYENSENVQLNYQSGILARFKFMGKLIPTMKIVPHHHVLTALYQKYPDIDYFTNIRFDKETIVKSGLFGKTFSENIKVTADGIELKTDE